MALFQIPLLVDIVRVGNQKSGGDALAALTACVVRPAALAPHLLLHSSCFYAKFVALVTPAHQLSLQNLCSNEAAAPVFAGVEAFYRVGTLVASSKSQEFLQTGCM